MANERRAIKNPFVQSEEYNCFGCDPGNLIGLKLQFELVGDEVVARWEPRRDLEGFPGIVHGGIQATLADEVAAWWVMAVKGLAGVTRELRITYSRPALRKDGPFDLRAHRAEVQSPEATAKPDRLVSVAVTMENANRVVCAESVCDYTLFSERLSRDKLGYPGREALFDEN